MIGTDGERKSRNFILSAQLDEDDDKKSKTKHFDFRLV